MAKSQKLFTKEEETKTKRKRLIKNSTYALIVACTVMLGATLVAVNMANTNSTAVIQTSTSETNYVSPIQNASVLKDYNSGQLQYNDTLKQWEIHKAIDLISDTDNKVLSIANGTVTNVYTNYLEGSVVEISHSNGLVSVYKSLNQDLKVSLGEYVKQGDTIGTVSNSMSRELSSGNHLHFEMFLNKVAINPNDYIDFSKK
ncbi:MAG: M23 family metallopeptidase [Clostridia bacterium]|nr:M23 family metallopeptidase [Clostridia bacterium]